MPFTASDTQETHRKLLWKLLSYANWLIHSLSASLASLNIAHTHTQSGTHDD